MNKITSGILGLVVSVSLVSAVAYAAFSDTVTVSGIEITTGGVNLQIQGNFNGAYGSIEENINLGNTGLNTLSPGESDWAHFRLYNVNTDDIDLELSAQLISAGSEWNSLKDWVQVDIYELDPSDDTTREVDPIASGTLAEWNTGSIAWTGDDLVAGTDRDYHAVFTLDVDAPNSAAGKTLSDIVFDIVGTQVTP